MHRYVAGTCEIALTLKPLSMWVVSTGEGVSGAQPLRDVRGRPYIPASSLKGVLRSTAERILRTVDAGTDEQRAPLADIPFVHGSDALKTIAHRRDVSDSELLAWNAEHQQLPASALRPDVIYAQLSAATQLFGSTTHAGLVVLNDACAADSTSVRRPHVAIDRFTGGVGQGPFTDELVHSRPLTTTLTITNFALWHVGLFALVFQEFNLGFARIGGGTRKGQGEMEIAVEQLTFRYASVAYPGGRGVISAQGRLASAPYYCADEVPCAVLAVEWPGGTPLRLGTVEPSAGSDWRESGWTTLRVGAEGCDELLRSAVEQAWAPWIDEVCK